MTEATTEKMTIDKAIIGISKIEARYRIVHNGFMGDLAENGDVYSAQIRNYDDTSMAEINEIVRTFKKDNPDNSTDIEAVKRRADQAIQDIQKWIKEEEAAASEVRGASDVTPDAFPSSPLAP